MSLDLDIVEMRLDFLKSSEDIKDYQEWIEEFAKPLIEELRKQKLENSFIQSQLDDAEMKLKEFEE